MNELAFKEMKRWLESDKVSSEEKQEILAMSQEKQDFCFFKDIEFGTGGMRGILSPGSNCLNRFTIQNVIISFGQYLLSNKKVSGVVIAYDNRHMSKEFALLATSILNTQGINTYLFDSLRPTPELSFAIRYLKASGGIMITASHNPKEYNGIKLYDEKGCQLTPDSIKPVLDKMSLLGDPLDSEVTPLSKLKGLNYLISEEIDDKYLEAIKTIQVNPDLDKKNFKIVFTPNHGTSCKNVIRLFSELGYNLIPVLSQLDPDPDFKGVISPNPEEDNAYIEPIKVAKENKANIIIMTDPDGDRFGLAYLNKEGEYKKLSGNKAAAILLDYILSNRKLHGDLASNGVIYDTIVSSDLARKVANFYGVKVKSFLTGFKYIGNQIAINEESSNPDTFLFGYEESHGCLLSPFVRDKDGIQAILLLAEMSLFYFLQGITLDEVIESLEKRFSYHSNLLTNIFFEGVKGLEEMENKLSSLRANTPSKIGDYEVIKVEDYLLSISKEVNGETVKIDLPKSNVMKFYLSDGSSICIRPSGTEPKCKIYVEAISPQKSINEAKAITLSNSLLDILNTQS